MELEKGFAVTEGPSAKHKLESMAIRSSRAEALQHRCIWKRRVAKDRKGVRHAPTVYFQNPLALLRTYPASAHPFRESPRDRPRAGLQKPL